jgi:hypothetical protein
LHHAMHTVLRRQDLRRQRLWRVMRHVHRRPGHLRERGLQTNPLLYERRVLHQRCPMLHEPRGLLLPRFALWLGRQHLQLYRH